MRTLAEEILTNNRSFVEELAEEYPAHFDTNNLTITKDNYFYVASKYRLGTAQSAQFQSGDQYGADWHWGSKCTEANGTITCDDETTPANNALAQMPREYYQDDVPLFGSYYNAYAATAGTVTFSMTSGEVYDSLCPSGWKLPSYDASADDSWYNLLITSYGLTNQATDTGSETENSRFPRKTPLSITLAGNYEAVSGIYQNKNRFGFLWTNTDVSDRMRDFTINLRGRLNTQEQHHKYYGQSIRCIKE